MTPGSDAPAPEKYARIAVSGTGWAAGQTILNKVATLLSTWVVARCLTSDEVGAASLAVVVTKFLCVLPPLNMGDVLISHGRRTAWLGSIAGRIAVWIGLLVSLGAVLLSPAVAAFYGQYPKALFIGLLCVAAFRPLGEALQVRPLVSLRMAFRNRAIALIDGLVQLAATATTTALALLHVGAWALVVPQVAAGFVKAACYRGRESSGEGQASATEHRPSRTATRRIRGEFLAAGSAQYVHSLVDTLPLLVLGRFATESETGFYAFAFNLAAQANTMVASQIASVLQPVLGRMKDDPTRQTGGYLRALRTLSAFAVPVCLTQAAFGDTLFALVFDARWQPAARIFSILSLSESFFFAASPTMALLKAQGRFRTFLAWQGTQLAVSLVVFPLMADREGALGIAVAAAAIWAASLPIAVWIGIRERGHSLLQALRLFAAPWSTALPIASAGWLGASWIGQWGPWGHALSLALLAPTCLMLMLLATRISQPSVYHEAAPVVSRIIRRVADRVRR